MKWNDVIAPVTVMTEADAKEFMDSHETGTYQLLDVRLHEEYEDEHLPGATLIPLNELMENQRINELDADKPTIVYCRSGGRSRAASQWLTEQGFKEVYDISGHIVDWMGLQLEGGYDMDLNLINKNIEFSNAFQMAFAMEEGLQQFYYDLEKNATENAHKEIYRQLAGYEDLHKEQLKKRFEGNSESDFNVNEVLAKEMNLVEGGASNEKNPFDIVAQMKDVKDIWGLSLAIEAQSFDLYVRLANKAEDQASKELFLEMADEEKQHMNYITRELSKHLS